MGMARCIASRFGERHQIDLLEVELLSEGLLGDRLLGDGRVHVVVAASIYMASHMFGEGRSLDLVSSFDGIELHGIEVQATRKAYASLYRYRYALIREELLVRAGKGWHEIEDILPSVMA